MWVARCDGPANNYDAAHALAADNSGNVYVAGGSCGTGTNSDYLTIKYTQHDYCTNAIAGDRNSNCKVDFVDYAILALDWLAENDWDDLATLADNWLDCNFALSEDCW